MRNLRDILALFNEDILNHTEGISYLDGSESFRLMSTPFELDGDYQIAEIWLWEDGSTALIVPRLEKTKMIFDDTVDFYVKVRDTWKFNV